MRGAPKVAAALAVSAWLAACNGLTGADSFEIGGDEAPGTGDADAGEGVTASRDGETPSPPDAGPRDAKAPGDAATPLDGAPPEDAGPCEPTSSGPRYGATAQGAGWTDDDGALAPNDDRFAHSNGTANPLTARGFGFALPPTATVLGIQVAIRRTAIGPVSDGAIRLSSGASKTNGPWPQGPIQGPYVETTYGSPTDLWDADWTASAINGDGFVVSLTPSGPGDGHVDSISVTVFHCP